MQPKGGGVHVPCPCSHPAATRPRLQGGQVDFPPRFRALQGTLPPQLLPAGRVSLQGGLRTDSPSCEAQSPGSASDSLCLPGLPGGPLLACRIHPQGRRLHFYPLRPSPDPRPRPAVASSLCGFHCQWSQPGRCPACRPLGRLAHRSSLSQNARSFPRMAFGWTDPGPKFRKPGLEQGQWSAC